MTKRAASLFLWICLLLAGQQIALVHSVWHLRDYLPAHGQHGYSVAAQSHQDDGRPSESRLCVFHCAMGSLLAGDCSVPPVVPTTIADSHWPATLGAVGRYAQAATTPPSRAPPVLL